MAHKREGWKKVGSAVRLNARGGRISGQLSVWPCTGISDSSTRVSATELLL